MGTIIRHLVAADLPTVANIHCLAFPGSALTKLGLEAVNRYYDWQMHGPHDATLLGVLKGDALVGFCFCGSFRGAMSGFVRKNRNFLAKRILLKPWLLFGNEFRDRIKVGLKGLRKHQDASPYTDPSLAFGILAIAVSPGVQGIGGGKLLMMEAERCARARGFTRMQLSVALNNRQAIAFYERIGWQRTMEEGIWKGHMTKGLD